MEATVLRRTSVYALTILGDSELLDALVRRCPSTTSARVDGEKIILAYRVAGGDGPAIEIAEDLAEGRPFELTTGVAVNKRDVLHG